MEVYHEFYRIETNSNYDPSANNDCTICGFDRRRCFHTGTIPNCPFTLQILFTTLAGIVLGSRLGAASVGIYIVLGLIGVPIFTSGGGPGYILQPTFGYLIGFMVGAYVVGRIAESMDTLSFKRLLVGSILNLLIVYGLGMVYLYFIMNLYLGKPIGVEAVIITCFLIPVGPDIFLCAVAASLGKRIVKELHH